jgi:exodeoxyribonuclease VII large subunit
MEFEDVKQKNLFEAGPLTVGKFVEQLNSRIKPLAAKIIGEVSEAKPGPTGHIYFSLKDENGGAVMSCALWKSRADLFGIQLKVGMKVIASGHCEIYPPSGRLSFICDAIELAGEGALKAAYDKLLKKLESEGIFAPKKKRAIPRYCRKIGIITAKQGAVIHDFLNNIGKFGFQIEFIDSRVEGQLAVGDLLASINTFKSRQIDVLVIMRGGGSLEAMLAFNNETIVRRIASFPAPVIAAIGHDKDVPLAAMAADAMCSTPTAAANLLTQSWQEIPRALDRYAAISFQGYKNAMAQKNLRLKEYAAILANFKFILQRINRQIQDTAQISMVKIKNRLAGAAEKIAHFQELIAARDPARQLRLGYCIAKINGAIVKRASDAKAGDDMDIVLSDGIINSQIKKVYGREKEN